MVEQEGDIKAWVRLAFHRRGVRAQMTIHPSWEGDLRGLVAFVLDQARPRPVFWEVPESQEVLRLTMERAGFQPLTSNRLMVKSLAVRINSDYLKKYREKRTRYPCPAVSIHIR